MDRLPSLTVAFAVLWSSGCRDEPATHAPPTSRVNAVMAAPPRRDAVESFCDVRAPAGEGRAYAPPALAEGTPMPARGWRWINVWATWCHPCVDELPLLVRWRSRLAADGVALEFLSIDAAPEDVATFRASHAGTPASLRIRDPNLLPAWLASVGLSGGASVPVQVFVDPTGRVRCVRSGSVTEADYPTIHQLVTAPAAH
jgi:thiol-disulfide isomerase/thioredoxin